MKPTGVERIRAACIVNRKDKLATSNLVLPGQPDSRQQGACDEQGHDGKPEAMFHSDDVQRAASDYSSPYGTTSKEHKWPAAIRPAFSEKTGGLTVSLGFQQLVTMSAKKIQRSAQALHLRWAERPRGGIKWLMRRSA
ncbi:hypothetical protein [Dyella sp.]|uniref:hypothetical protein n=1 Tax=Dyella sp. TaxID=1869338 RepID=UPI002FDB82E0